MKKPVSTAILFKSRFKWPVYILFLKNSSVQWHPHIREDNIKALAFMKSQQRILIATTDPSQVVSVSLDGRSRVVLHKGIRAQHMTVDEDKQIVFLASSKPAEIHRLSAKSGNSTVIMKSANQHISSIDLDTTNNAIYVSVHRKIISVAYDGAHKKVITLCAPKTVLTLDPNGQVLYFNIKKVLYKRSLVDNSTIVVMSTFDHFHNIAYSDNKIYASPSDRQQLGIIYTERERVQYISLTNESTLLYSVIFCLIP